MTKLNKEKKIKSEKVHLVGHSMGSEIIASTAVNNSEVVSSLTLLDPSGVDEKENIPLLFSKFVASGIHASAKYNIAMYLSGEGDYEGGLYDYIPERKQCVVEVEEGNRKRWRQRLAEGKKFKKGQLLEKLKKIAKNIPVNYIAGEKDWVYPPGKTTNEDDVINASSHSGKVAEIIGVENIHVLAGLPHNTTLSPDEIVAVYMDNCFKQSEYRNRIEEVRKSLEEN